MTAEERRKREVKEIAAQDIGIAPNMLRWRGDELYVRADRSPVYISDLVGPKQPS